MIRGVGMIEVINQDITTLDVEAVVNAANQSLLGGGGVDGAIHRAAGRKLVAYCRGLGGCPVGEARLTPGFRLPAKWVIHTVGPVWHGGDQGEAELLERCYDNSFRLATAHGMRSIAFPCISTGVYGYPFKEAATIAISVMRRHETGLERIVACCFSPADADVYRAVMASVL